jgi:hypothetical protein
MRCVFDFPWEMGSDMFWSMEALLSLPPSRHHLLVTLVSALVLCAGCYAAFETPQCFQDGAPFEKPANQSDLCCDALNPEQGNATCRDLYRDEANYAGGGIAGVAQCVEPGVCTIICEPASCDCVVGRDCRTSGVCLAVDTQTHPLACDDDVVRCTRCAQCVSDGSNDDLVCPDGQTCEEVTGSFGLCVP